MSLLLASRLPADMEKKIRYMVGHRGITHSLLFPLELSILAWQSSGPIRTLIICLVIGWLSHIVLDLFSGGVLLLLPFYFRRIKLADIYTGGIAERNIRILLFIGVVLLFMKILTGILN